MSPIDQAPSRGGGEPRSDHRLHSLIDALCDGQIDPPGFAELEARLQSDARARRVYLESLELHAALLRSRMPAPQAGSIPREAPDARRLVRARNGTRLIAIAAATALLVAATLLIRSRSASVPTSASVVATLVACDSVLWAGSPQNLNVGDQLRVGQSLRLDRGTARLRFERGALVTLEGPAAIEIQSDMRVQAIRGKVTTRVSPEARIHGRDPQRPGC